MIIFIGYHCKLDLQLFLIRGSLKKRSTLPLNDVFSGAVTTPVVLTTASASVITTTTATEPTFVVTTDFIFSTSGFSTTNSQGTGTVQ